MTDFVLSRPESAVGWELSGYCECGCGAKTSLATRTYGALGMVKGQPFRFVRGHASRKHHPTWLVDDASGCWVWQGQVNDGGYGVVYVSGQRYVRAHSWVYERFVGTIPEHLQLDHLCRNRRCVNPAHLEPVTPRENTLRGASPAAQHAKVTHCPKGHPYSGDNLYVCPRGTRRCRACRRESMRGR